MTVGELRALISRQQIPDGTEIKPVVYGYRANKWVGFKSVDTHDMQLDPDGNLSIALFHEEEKQDE